MPGEHDRVVLTRDLSEAGLEAGDVRVVVHVHRNGKALEVEFLALDGNTVAVVTVRTGELRAVTARDISHARMIPAPA